MTRKTLLLAATIICVIQLGQADVRVYQRMETGNIKGKQDATLHLEKDELSSFVMGSKNVGQKKEDALIPADIDQMLDMLKTLKVSNNTDANFARRPHRSEDRPEPIYQSFPTGQFNAIEEKVQQPPLNTVEGMKPGFYFRFAPSAAAEQPPSAAADQPTSAAADQPPSAAADQPPSAAADQPPSAAADQPAAIPSSAEADAQKTEEVPESTAESSSRTAVSKTEELPKTAANISTPPPPPKSSPTQSPSRSPPRLLKSSSKTGPEISPHAVRVGKKPRGKSEVSVTRQAESKKTANQMWKERILCCFGSNKNKDD